MEEKKRYESLWVATTPSTNYPALSENMKTDVVVVGGGIVGITTAFLLKQAGVQVILIESGRIVELTTGNTTAKVTSQHGIKYSNLLKKYAKEGVRMYAMANEAAVKKVKELVDTYKIDCDFYTTQSHTYASQESDRKKVEEEVKASQEFDLPASFVDDIALPFKTYGSVKFDNQGQFHPRKYLLHLIQQIDGNGSFVFENTKAQGIKKNNGNYTVSTDKGDVTADYVVIATHTPFVDPDMYYKKMAAYRDYAIAIRIPGEAPSGTYIGTTIGSLSIRNQPHNDELLLIVGGMSEDEDKASNPEERFKMLESSARGKFGIEDILYRWFTFDYDDPQDGVPTIGRLTPTWENVYVATGFAGWGMTHGTVAGMTFSGIITKNKPIWSTFYDRFERERFKLNE